VQLKRGGLTATGSVAWVESGACGLHFITPIALEDWIPSAGQQRVDKALKELRSGVVEQADKQEPHQTSSDLAKRISQELDHVSRILDELGNSLTDDAYVAARHGIKLQNLDIAMQILGHLSRVIESSDPDETIRQIGMAELRRRLLPSKL